MNLLLTNDDGIYSPGLKILANTLRILGTVTVVAPDTERSAVGHSITINHPLRVKEVKQEGRVFGYAVNGTPADCIKIALGAIMEDSADIVVAGINHGLNIGTSIMYSGTVSGAMEGVIFGLPALAISAEIARDEECTEKEASVLSFAADFAVQLIKIIHDKGLPDRTLLNVNFPFCTENEIKGVVVTKQGQTYFIDHFQRRLDPRRNVYYWLEGEDIEMEGGDGLDYIAIRKGYISITPLGCDLTNYRYLEELRKLDILSIPKNLNYLKDAQE